jgi:hypothetical protein
MNPNIQAKYRALVTQKLQAHLNRAPTTDEVNNAFKDPIILHEIIFDFLEIIRSKLNV